VPNTPGPWVEEWLSQPRFDRYLRECSGDRERALATYEWNVLLAHAFLRDAGHFEVALRNAYDCAIGARWAGSAHWLLDPASPVQRPLWRVVRGKRLDVNTPNRTAITNAVRKTGGSAATVTPGAVVAELTFGFWEHLADAAHEQTLWIPYVYFAWPQGTARRQVDAGTRSIGGLRNRAAHNEPIFTATSSQSLATIHATLIGLVSMLNPDLGAHVRQTSTVSAVLAQRP